MNLRRTSLGILVSVIALSAFAAVDDRQTTSEQIAVGPIEHMPNFPQPYHMRDWKKVARDYDRLAFDPNTTGDYLPLLRWDRSHANGPLDMASIPSYVGHQDANITNHEAINVMSAVLGASLVGIDKSSQNGKDWVSPLSGYFQSTNKDNMFLNRASARSGETFWYDLYPNILAFALADRCRDAFTSETRKVADRLYEGCVAMGGTVNPLHAPDFDHTGYDFLEHKARDNGRWREPDAAAAFAWMSYVAWTRWKDPRYMQAADWSLQFLDERPVEKNPMYEVLMPFGALAAARSNAEQGRKHDVGKMLTWCFGPSTSRPGWGIIRERWGTYDVSGLGGSLTDGGGYAFAMNTFSNFGTLVPIARYDSRFAHAIGKYALNAANAARLFYGDGLPPDHQSSFPWIEKYDPDRALAYEGLRSEWQEVAPSARGDGLANGWAKTDIGLYGSSHVGMLATIVEATDVEGILALDLLATDYWHAPAYPTHLYYNPHSTEKTITIATGAKSVDLYDASRHLIEQKNRSGSAKVTIPADTALIIVEAPAGGVLTHDANRTLINSVVVDYNNGKVALPPSSSPGMDTQTAGPGKARAIGASAGAKKIDGLTTDWDLSSSQAITLNDSPRGKLAIALRFAWDKDFLYILGAETAGTGTAGEAADSATFAKGYWEYDGVGLFMDLTNTGSLDDSRDFNPWYGLSSTNRTDLFGSRSHRPGPFSSTKMPHSKVATGGSAAKGDRVVEVALAWEDIAGSVRAPRQPGGNLPAAVKPGYRFGCEPLLLDGAAKTQAFVGGAVSPAPSGFDENSLDIILE